MGASVLPLLAGIGGRRGHHRLALPRRGNESGSEDAAALDAADLDAAALDAAAGPGWNADSVFDVRLQDVALTNRRPDVVVYRADTIDLMPTRPEHALLVAEIVSPGSETTDRRDFLSVSVVQVRHMGSRSGRN